MGEDDPVNDDEFVFRRIHQIYYDPALHNPIQREAFRPTQNDSTGLSVFRALFTQPSQILAGLAPDKARQYYVARLAVRDLRNLGLTVVPDPLPNGPLGHAIIPELSRSAYQSNKNRWKPILVQLAMLAAMDIVHQSSV